MPSRDKAKKKLGFREVSKNVQDKILKLYNNDCPVFKQGIVDQSAYRRKTRFKNGVEEVKEIKAVERKNGSRSLNTVFNCRMSKKERLALREANKAEQELMPQGCTENQKPVVGYYRFDSAGNAYKVEGFCRDIKLSAEKINVAAPEPVKEYVEQQVKMERERRIRAKREKMLPLGAQRVKLEPGLQQQQQQRVKQESGMPALESVSGYNPFQGFSMGVKQEPSYIKQEPSLYEQLQKKRKFDRMPLEFASLSLDDYTSPYRGYST